MKMKLPLKGDTVILLAILGVGVASLYFMYKRRGRGGDDDDDDGNGRQFAKKGPKQYPFSYTSLPYEDIEDIIEDVCDRQFKGKCRQECANGASQQCLDCLTVCEKTSYRLRY